jgi:hypothetical protein
MQVKIFIFSSLAGYGDQVLEKRINSWLTENPNVKVKFVKTEILEKEPGENLIVFVFYEGELGEGTLKSNFVG